MKLWLAVFFVGSVALMTFVGYLYGRRAACREEAMASLTINTSTAAAIRLGRTDAALHYSETAISIAADGLERYNQPFGAIRVWFNGQKSPGKAYEALRVKNTNEYLERYSVNEVSPGAASYLHALAH